MRKDHLQKRKKKLEDEKSGGEEENNLQGNTQQFVTNFCVSWMLQAMEAKFKT